MALSNVITIEVEKVSNGYTVWVCQGNGEEKVLVVPESIAKLNTEVCMALQEYFCRAEVTCIGMPPKQGHLDWHNDPDFKVGGTD
jgi:hypothetical protein